MKDYDEYPRGSRQFTNKSEIEKDEGGYLNRHDKDRKTMKGKIFSDFLRAMGVKARDEKKAMRHFDAFLEYHRNKPDAYEDEDDYDDDWDGEDRFKKKSAYADSDRTLVKQKRKLERYQNEAYDDDDDDYLKDRLRQNAQYYT